MYIHPAGNVQRPGWVPFTSRGQDGMPILRFLVEAAQADRRGSVQAPISQVGAELLQSVSGERRTSIPSCRSVFVRPAGLLPGLLTAHRSRQLASLRSVQRGRPLRRSAAIPPNAVTSLSPCWSCEAWSHADRRVRLEAKRSVRGLGESQQAHGGIESDIPMPCLPASFYLSGSRC